LFFKKELLTITNYINYCEKEKQEIDNFRRKSIYGIIKKYNWDFITSQYLEVFNFLVKQRN